MSRKEYKERIARMLDKVSLESLDRIYNYLSGWMSAIALMEEKRRK